MKKTFLLVAALTVTVAASAQSWQDALLFSENNYGGTARSVALGNALTAVGGDMGSIGLNPAGSAVAGYSQMGITIGLSGSGASATSLDPEVAFGDRVHTNWARLKMPNIGFVLNMNTGNRSGLRRVSFGFVSNATHDYTSRMYAGGVNASNSFSGSVASSAAGYPEDVLSGDSRTRDWWNLDEYNDTYGLDWRDMVAFRSGIFGQVNGRYLGLTDWDKDGYNTGVLAPLYQKFGFQTKGYKHDLLINAGFNFNDEFYLGATVGLVRLAYGQAEYWYEAPNNYDEFPAIPFDSNPNARFNYLEMKRIFEADGSGAYLKVGVIYAPAGTGLRLGAALQTPTVTNIDTRMSYYGKASVTGVALPAASSPEWEDAYALVSPCRFNAGIAYTFGKAGMLSADYEVVNYGQSFFRNQTESQIYYDKSYFDYTNADIRDILGISHMLRVGLEINLAKGFAVRGGYGFTTAPQHNRLNWEYDPSDNLDHLVVIPLSEKERTDLLKQQFSVGFGYTRGACYTDFALRYRIDPRESYIPYRYYSYEGSDYTDKYEVADAPYTVPEVSASYRRLEAMVTFGVRF